MRVVPGVLNVYWHLYKTSVSSSLPDRSIYMAICSAMLPVVILHYFEPLSHCTIKRKVYISPASRDAN